MSILKIALLGPPQVHHLHRRLTFCDRKALALLAYLAAEGGVHERQKLTRLLWPESDMAHGRTALRITLLHVRHILEEDASPERESHLLITHNTLGLDLASGVDLDLHALESAWKLVRALPAPVAPVLHFRWPEHRNLQGTHANSSKINACPTQLPRG